jgi:hypothetical protein
MSVLHLKSTSEWMIAENVGLREFEYQYRISVVMEKTILKTWHTPSQKQVY